MLRTILFSIVMLYGMNGLLTAQSILMERGVQVKGLWCYPLLSDTNSYLYLPNEASLGSTPDGLPEFSLLRYVINSSQEEDPTKVISKAAGGAIVHFLVTYRTNEKKIKRAETALRQKLDNEDIRIKGPVLFNRASYALISSVLTKGGRDTTLLTVGDAPVLEGGKLAFSFQLSPEASKLLLESFKMATPDLSLLFDFTFSGYSERYNAEMTVDWSRVYQQEKKNRSGGFLFTNADVQKTIETLHQKQAIQLITDGEDKASERLVEMAYKKATDLLFAPVDLKQYRDDNKRMEKMTKIYSRFASSMGQVSVQLSYQWRKIRMQGHSHFSFRKRIRTEQHYLLAFNIGDLYKQYGDNEQIFKTVNLDDPDFHLRKVFVGIDGQLAAEFGHMINNVTVTLKKIHADSTETLEPYLVRRDSLSKLSDGIIYANHKDYDRAKWLKYTYKTHWHFQGGGELETPWRASDAAMINLFVPYEYRTIYLDGDLEALWATGIRSVVVSLEYDFFDKTITERKVIRRGDQLQDHAFQITVPAGQYDCRYTITWFNQTGPFEDTSGTDEYGMIIIDQLPE